MTPLLRWLAALSDPDPTVETVEMACAGCGFKLETFERLHEPEPDPKTGALIADYVGRCGWHQTSTAGGCAELLDCWRCGSDRPRPETEQLVISITATHPRYRDEVARYLRWLLDISGCPPLEELRR